MNALKMCLNWKAITGVAIVTAGLFVFAPSFAAAALPFLVLAICPLSMVLMMAMMNGGKSESLTACPTGNTNTKSPQPSTTPEEQLKSLEAQHQNLVRQMAALESEASRTSGTHQSGASAAARPY